jgi:hypothetical protein
MPEEYEGVKTKKRVQGEMFKGLVSGRLRRWEAFAEEKLKGKVDTMMPGE